MGDYITGFKAHDLHLVFKRDEGNDLASGLVMWRVLALIQTVNKKILKSSLLR